MAALPYRERPAAGAADGLLLLNHGRGSDETDLLALADLLDPARRLDVVCPRAPLRLPDSPGYHWYVVRRVGYPDPAGFTESLQRLGSLASELRAQTGLGPERTVIGGFSQGTVMSYAVALDPAAPILAGVLAMSGFIPTVRGWEPALSSRSATRVLISHGRQDPVIHVGFARAARDELEQAGFDLDYRESDAAHHIDAADIPRVQRWLRIVLPPASED